MDQTAAFYDSPVQYLQDRFSVSVDPGFPPSPHPTSTPGIAASSYPLQERGREVSSRSSDTSNTSRTLQSSRTSHVLFRDDWKHTWPQYFVMFGSLLGENNGNVTVRALLVKHQYTRVWRTWNGFEEDEKRRGGVEVWRWQGSDAAEASDTS